MRNAQQLSLNAARASGALTISGWPDRLTVCVLVWLIANVAPLLDAKIEHGP